MSWYFDAGNGLIYAYKTLHSNHPEYGVTVNDAYISRGLLPRQDGQIPGRRARLRGHHASKVKVVEEDALTSLYYGGGRIRHNGGATRHDRR